MYGTFSAPIADSSSARRLLKSRVDEVPELLVQKQKRVSL